MSARFARYSKAGRTAFNGGAALADSDPGNSRFSLYCMISAFDDYVGLDSQSRHAWNSRRRPVS